jgi:ABC-type branched-subunit amino acid transport system substrate-binding protein
MLSRTTARRHHQPIGHRSGQSALAVLLPLAAAVWVAACSVLVDTTADQCSKDADCTSKGAAFAGMVCSAQGVCAKPAGAAGASGAGGAAGSAGAAGAEGGCTTNLECVTKLGDNQICRKTDHVCVSLLSEDCIRVVGDYKNDDAFFVGSVAPTVGSDQSTGLAIQNSIELALNDFLSSSNGLPPAKPGGASRPIVLVGCNDNSDSDIAVRAAQHLVGDLGVPAIIGAAFSGITIKMATTVTIPGGTLVISPSATSTAITDLADNGLVWRTSPSDVIQSDALVKFMPQLEAEVRSLAGLAADAKMKVAMLNKGDSYGKGLSDSLITDLSFNGLPALENADNFVSFNYGNPDDPKSDPTKYPDALTKIFQLKPHLIMVFGTNEGVTEIFQKVEEGWATEAGASYRPFYIFSDGGEVTDLWEYLRAKDADDSMRKRVIGTVPGTNNANYKIFRNLYNSKISDGTTPDIFGTAGAYDAMYLLAFAASTASEGITGASLAQGLGRLVPPGATIKAVSGQINPGFTALQSGQNIDFEGASGQLNFDVKTGEASSDIQFWCSPKGSDGKAATGSNTGAFYDAATQAVSKDAMATLKAFCQF